MRIGVIQTLSQSARTGQNWYSHENRGSCLFAGAGLFSGNYREKSPLTGAITSNFKAGDLIGVHVRGEQLTFSKNGVRIPGEMCRSGVFAATLFFVVCETCWALENKNSRFTEVSFCRAGPVYLGVQLCNPGDQVTLIKRCKPR